MYHAFKCPQLGLRVMFNDIDIFVDINEYVAKQTSIELTMYRSVHP
jgi:hypothetical protein